MLPVGELNENKLTTAYDLSTCFQVTSLEDETVQGYMSVYLHHPLPCPALSFSSYHPSGRITL